MNSRVLLSLALAAGTSLATAQAASAADAKKPAGIDQIETIVVIYAENRSFDNLYGYYPGANGLQHVKPAQYLQRDRDGTVMKELPPIWEGLTAKGETPAITEAQTAHLPNRLFAIDDPKGFNASLSVTTRDLWHRFYENQMQIDGGKNDLFAAWADSGGLVMGYYKTDAKKLPLWKIAQDYTLADNFFMGAFGGSFLNHFWLVCACTPTYPNADKSPAKDSISVVNPDGVSLKVAANAAKSAVEGGPKFERDGNLTPDFYAINTMQPPYQPSAVKPPEGGDKNLADPKAPNTLPPQTMLNIGDLLAARGISWAWYSGAWQAVLDHGNSSPVPSFQYHHQVFNYFENMAPGTAARKTHLLDGGLDGVEFIKAIDAGKLPQVTFYKPQGNLNEHAGYTQVLSGDQHIADVIQHLQKSPQWTHMLIVVTYDENGGFWDHVAPPKADRWGPGSRVPAIIISPFAKRHYVDHTQYDTTSILRLITRRFRLEPLPGLTARDQALKAHHEKPLGDLTHALTISAK